MLTITHHATKRFVQRHYKGKKVKKSDIKEAEKILNRWFNEATPLENNRYLYKDFVLVCKENTIITIYPKPRKD